MQEIFYGDGCPKLFVIGCVYSAVAESTQPLLASVLLSPGIMSLSRSKGTSCGSCRSAARRSSGTGSSASLAAAVGAVAFDGSPWAES